MDLFTELSIVIVFTAVVAGVMRLFKQPIVIGYIVTGVLLGPQVLNLFKSQDLLSVFSEMGVAILLFIVGLHLSPSEVKGMGKSAVFIGFLQVVMTAGLGYLLSITLGFSSVESIYIGMALSFSSTIIVLKLLSDKKDVDKLYWRIAIAVLLLQDIVASFSLIVSSTFSGGEVSITKLGWLLVKGVFLSLFITGFAYKVLPKLSTFFAKSQEYLFIFSIAWGFGLAFLYGHIGLSVEIGALLAGVALSITPYSQEISSRLRSLRDFFVVMFFITLGSQVTFIDFRSMLYPFLALLIFIIFIKPIIIVFLMLVFKYNKKTAFFAGISLGQISEFSMILLLLGVKLGHLDMKVMSLLTILAIISITISTYLIMYLEKIYPFFVPLLRLFERKKSHRETNVISSYEVILFGCNRVGFDFIRIFQRLGSGFLAVDFDPEVIKDLQKEKINCKYGDVEDAEFLDDIGVEEARLVVSTIPDFEANSFLLGEVRKTNQKSMVILLSYNIDDAIKFYELGATYVVLPHFISGEFAAHLAEEAGFDIEKITQRRDEHIKYLHERKRLGHMHPIWAHNILNR